LPLIYTATQNLYFEEKCCTMRTKDLDQNKAVRHLNRCFAIKLCLGAPLCERFITAEEKEQEKRIRATYNC
jgi:hypothetical protein